VVVDVMLKPEILDPAGQAVAGALPRLGVTDVASVRIGKRVEIEFTGEPDLAKARQLADALLANPVIENFTVRVEEAGQATPAGAIDAISGLDPVEPDVPAVIAPRRLDPGTPLVEARPVETAAPAAPPAPVETAAAEKPSAAAAEKPSTPADAAAAEKPSAPADAAPAEAVSPAAAAEGEGGDGQ
jgi:phosphoribosylformylglycinamidine synthase